MLTIRGKIINTFVSPKGEKDGKEYGGQDKIQIIGDISLPDGGKRVDMLTLTTHNIGYFSDLVGEEVSVPVGVFAANRAITYYIPKGSKPIQC